MIQFINVTKEYRNGTVGLRNINVKIEDGEFAFLIGASGAGKSTFTKLMIREITPTSGSILIDGKGIHRLKKREIPIFRRNMGFVFQNYRLLSDRTAFENVAFAMEALGYGKAEVERRVMYALEQMGLANRAEHFPAELSGGEQQRVAIARAIVNHPKILVADEPTGNLDYETSREIMDILYDINEKGTTVLMATHDRSIVEKSHHRILTLAGGELVGDDNLPAGYAIGKSDVKRILSEDEREEMRNKKEFHLASTEMSRINSQLSSETSQLQANAVPNRAKAAEERKTPFAAPKARPAVKTAQVAKERLLSETAAMNENSLLRNAQTKAVQEKAKAQEVRLEHAKSGNAAERTAQIQQVLAKSSNLKNKYPEQEPAAASAEKKTEKILKPASESEAPAAETVEEQQSETLKGEQSLDDLEKLILEAFK